MKIKFALLSVLIIFMSTIIVPSFGQYYYYPSTPPSPLPPQPDFSISASPSSLTMQQGTTASSIITVTSLNGFKSGVTLSISGNPSSVKPSFSPNPITPSAGASASSTLTITIGGSANPNTDSLTIIGISGSLVHSTTISLTISSSAAVHAQATSQENSVADVKTELMEWGGHSPISISDSQLLEHLGLHGNHIPSWFMKTARWVIDGEINQDDFLKALKYVYDNGIVDIFNNPGNVLISDQFNNRVIELNPVTKDIVWSFGSGNASLCNPGPGTIIGTNDAERLSDGLTLISGTGLPAGASGFMPKGCVDNRVIVVNQTGQIVWQYGQAGVAGSGPDMLSAPVFAIQLPNHNFLITDQGNNRIIEVNQTKQIVWSYGPTSGPGALNNPNSAELLPNDNILIADENNNRTIEISRDGNLAWQYNDTGLQTVAFASRLPSNNTLIVDSGHSRILEVSMQKDTVFQYFTNNTAKSNPLPLPSNAVRLANGETIIADQINERVIIIDSKGNTVFQYGRTNLAGVGHNELNWPYTAFVLGDYTGQTPPPSTFEPTSVTLGGG